MTKSVAVTGACGFVGSNLCDYLVGKNYKVFALVRHKNCRHNYSSSININYGDINNQNQVSYFIEKSQPDIFIHLAAKVESSSLTNSVYDYFCTNIIGTLNVLECLKIYNKSQLIIVASSAKVYGEFLTYPFTESDELKAIHPYDASKSATDILTNSYRLTYGMPIVITRAANIYGKSDLNLTRLIPAIVNSYKSGQKFLLRNQGSNLREYLHLFDLLSAYQKIIEYKLSGGAKSIFNISANDRYSTQEIFNFIQEIIGDTIQHEILDNKNLEINNQIMNSDLLINETLWKPKYNLKNSLPEIVNWQLGLPIK